MAAWPTGRSRDGGVDEIPLPGPGRLWLCGKHVVGPDPEGAMSATGATVVVCLCEEHELVGRYPAYVGWLRARSPGGALWWPVPDLHAPAPAEARALVTAVTARLDAGDGVLLHCGAGIGRAGTIAAAVLMAQGVTRADAVALVASRRPTAGPEAGAQTALLEALAGRDSGIAAAPPD